MPKMALSVILLKEGTTVKAALKSTAGLSRHIVKDGAAKIGDLYVAPAAAGQPRWRKYLVPFAPTLPDLKNRTTSAVLFVEASKRLFAVTFGYGRGLLDAEACEDGFGLRVVLNAVPADRLRTISKKSLDAFAHQTHTQSMQEGRLGEFGVDLEQDLLRAVTGSPDQADLGVRLVGKDSLAVITTESASGMPGLFGRLLKQFKSTEYRKKYPDIDRLKEIDDKSTIARLDAALISKLTSRDLDHLWLAVPDLIDWGRTLGFRYTPKAEDVFADLHVTQFVDHVGGGTGLSVSQLKTKRAYAIDAENEETYDDWSIYKCIHCEIMEDGRTCVLSGGKWFALERDFVKAVNKAIDPLLSYTGWPEYDDKDEGMYNKRLASSIKGAALGDKKLIYYGGSNSKVELCDLFTKDRQFLHVKRYAGSGVLSHLFNQGLVSAETLVSSSEFREKARAVLPASHRILVPVARPDPQKFEVVYGIVGRKRKHRSLSELLPFFSRVTLRRTAQRLDAFGFKCTVVWIEMASA